MGQPHWKVFKVICVVSPFALLLLFALFVSDSFSNVVAFGALLVSIFFIGVSVWMLGWILEKDEGT